jgi:hypothetical protein
VPWSPPEAVTTLRRGHDKGTTQDRTAAEVNAVVERDGKGIS